MEKIDLSTVDLDTFYRSINVEKIKSKLSNKKYEKITTRLESLIKADLTTIKRYLNISSYYNKEELTEIKNAFDYTTHRKQENFMEHFKKLGIKSCPFCNNNHIYFYKKGAGEFNTLATLEHYYPKAVYPHLSLSFFNLIPCCSICNTKFKSNTSHVGNILHPYYDSFNDRAEFRVTVGKRLIKKSIDLEVKLKVNHPSDKKCKNSIDRFQLDKIYTQHNDIAKEIWNKAQVYNESRIDELYEAFFKKLGYSKEDVKNMVFCNYLHKEDIHKRNHSKLTQDILKQFDLRK